jgi:DNA-binding phage protein
MSKQNLSSTIRGAIQKDARSLYQLWKETGVDQGLLSRFMRSERGINLRTAEILCEALGLELRPVRKPKKGG